MIGIQRIVRPLLTASCLLIALTLVLAPQRGAQAHANLVRSEPDTGAVLAQSPQTVTLEFSEALDPDLTKAKLVDSDLAVLAEGPGSIDPENDRILRLQLPALPDGAFNVVWQTRSAVDGHITSGVVTFSVGVSSANISLLPQPGAPDPTNERPPLADTLIRWLNYFAAAITAGCLLFGALVWRPAYLAWEASNSTSDQLAVRRLRQLARLGIAGLAVFTLCFLLVQAWEASQGAFQIPYSQALAALLAPMSGWIFWLRMIILGILAYLVPRLSPPGEEMRSNWWVAILLALAILLTFSLQSHAAALDSLLAVTVDWLHITAMAAWLGGLPPLFLLLRHTELPPHLLVPKFSRMALVCVTTLALSGLYSAYLQVHTLQALLATIYGLALAVKSVLFVILLGFGAINLLVLSPRLNRTREKAIQWLRNTTRTEIAVGSLVLLMVGLMTGVSPAFEALQARQRLGYIGEYQDRGTRMELWIAPARVGENEIAVDVHGKSAGLAEYQPQVLLRFQPADVDLGINQVEAAPQSNSRYSVKGSYMTISGNWLVEAILRQPGVDDVRHVFAVQVQPNPLAISMNNPVPASDRSLEAGQSLYESNCLPCHGPEGKGDGPAGLALHPPPADLTIHTAPGVHPDGQLFEWITNGYPGSAMPVFGERLDDVQRWDLVNYIRTFGRE